MFFQNELKNKGNLIGGQECRAIRTIKEERKKIVATHNPADTTIKEMNTMFIPVPEKKTEIWENSGISYVLYALGL